MMVPRYMTPMRSEIISTTARSWEMNRYVRLYCSWTSRSRFSTWAWMDTSSAETGSSAMMSLGFTDRARAMPMRWRWPPENSCG